MAEHPARPSRLYVASKTRHAPLWRALRASGVPIVASWIDQAELGETADLGDLWEKCVAEASAADALLLHVRPGEALKGALVELGAALASDRSVFWVGPTEGHSVTKHPRVRVFETLAGALDALGFSAHYEASALALASHDGRWAAALLRTGPNLMAGQLDPAGELSRLDAQADELEGVPPLGEMAVHVGELLDGEEGPR